MAAVSNFSVQWTNMLRVQRAKISQTTATYEWHQSLAYRNKYVSCTGIWLSNIDCTLFAWPMTAVNVIRHVWFDSTWSQQTPHQPASARERKRWRSFVVIFLDPPLRSSLDYWSNNAPCGDSCISLLGNTNIIWMQQASHWWVKLSAKTSG